MERRLGYELWRASQAQRAQLYEGLGDLKLTPPQYAALTLLEDAPGSSSAELARRSFVTAQTMQDVVASLERRELLARRARPQGGRVLAARLTDQGRALLTRAEGRVRAIEDRMTAGLGEWEREHLLDLLQRCAGALEASTTDQPAARNHGSAADA